MSVRVILSTGSLWIFDLDYAFGLAADAGYDGVEVMCGSSYNSREPAYLQQLSTAHGLPIPVLHAPFVSKVIGWGQSDTEQGRLNHTIALAEQIGAETVVAHLPFWIGRGELRLGRFRTPLPWFPPNADFTAWIRAGGLAQRQAETRVQIAMENMPAKVQWGRPINQAHWNSIAEWSRVHDYLTLDTTHWGTFRLNPVDALHAAGERVRHVHLSNYDGQEHRLPQRGHLDLGGFLRELAAMNYTGTVSIEVNPDALAFDNEGAMRRKLRETLDFCRHHLNG